MKLPEGNVHICFSGGRTSAFMLRKLLDAHGGALPDNWRVCFANTGKEFPQTLDFVQEVGERWSVPITWVEFDSAKRPDGKNAYLYKVVNHNSAAREGEPFEKLIRCKGYLPNVVARFCTAELKIRCTAKMLRADGWKTWTNLLGIRADEAKRAHPSRDHWKNAYPLIDLGATVADIAAFWKDQDFDLQLPNINGKCWKGNCDGCFLKSEESNAALWREHRERAQWWLDMEKEMGGKFSSRFSREELRDFVDKQGDWIFDTEGVLCQADEGECTG